MSFSARLCNPTPFLVELPWHRGVVIKIPPFGSTELTMAQMDDYRPGKPGTAEAQSVLNFHGVFLLDADRPYDNQALEALKKSHKEKKERYTAAVNNLVDRRAAVGVAPNDEALEATLKQMGYVTLREEIETLEKAISKFQEVVGTSPEQALRQQLDPKRTVFVTDPPREFPSVAAMEFFLEQNPDVKAEHQAWKQKQKVGGQSKTSQSNVGQQFDEQRFQAVRNETLNSGSTEGGDE